MLTTTTRRLAFLFPVLSGVRGGGGGGEGWRGRLHLLEKSLSRPKIYIEKI